MNAILLQYPDSCALSRFAVESMLLEHKLILECQALRAEIEAMSEVFDLLNQQVEKKH